MEPSPRNKAICLPWKSEAGYLQTVEDAKAFRTFLLEQFQQFPELFPQHMSQGFGLHDRRHSQKQDLPLRRIQIKTTGEVFLIRPSFVLPSMTAKAEQVEHALYLRQGGVPFEALAHVSRRNAKFWERQFLALGRPSLVGTMVKNPQQLPQHLVADEKHTRLKGQTVHVPTTAVGGCILGATVVESASEKDLQKGYGEFATEANDLDPEYQPTSVRTNGWSATQKAWKSLYPAVTVILCFLHSVLKIVEVCPKRFGRLRTQVLDWTWYVYQSKSRKGVFRGGFDASRNGPRPR